MERDAITAEIVANGGSATFLAGDVTDEAYSLALVERAITEFGGLDGAFNNVGTMGDNCPIPDMTTENWHSVIEANLTSASFAGRGCAMRTVSVVRSFNLYDRQSHDC